MKLKEYFRDRAGIGVLATADDAGAVDTAIYSKPHFMEDGTIAFIMRDRLTHANTQTNPRACYMFVEDGSKSKGVRLYLKKQSETDNAELIRSLSRRRLSPEEDEAKGPKYLVHFQVETILPLLGDQRTDLEL